MNVISCVTTHNEEQSIALLVCRLQKVSSKVIVVDAGSTDRTVEAARLAGARVLGLGTRLAIGPALRIAWSEALSLGAQAVLQIDAGGSHRVPDAERLLCGLQHGSDIVVGSRFTDGSVYSGRAWRKWASKFAAGMCSRTGYYPYLTDWTSGYRAFSARAARQLLSARYTASMHGWQIEVLWQAAQCGLTVSEVPISYFAGESSFSFRAAREAYRVWERMMGDV